MVYVTRRTKMEKCFFYLEVKLENKFKLESDITKKTSSKFSSVCE